MAATVFAFGEWLPDLPELNHPGLLEANNVVPVAGGYAPFVPYATLTAGKYTLPGTARGLYHASDGIISTYYAMDDVARLYMATSTGVFEVRSITLGPLSVPWTFAQYDNIVFAANTNTIYHTIGAATTATALSVQGLNVAVVGQFVVLGGPNGNYFNIRWSAVDDPTNFPTPSSATAIATQAGEQSLHPQAGIVRRIIGGDQYGLVFQTNAITRMTYVGPPVVFQFDEIDNLHGAYSETGVIRVGGVTYFLAADGFYATDGVSVRRIGYGKVDTSFIGYNATVYVRAGYSTRTKCIYWNFGKNSQTFNKLIIYNIETQSWTNADESLEAFDQSQLLTDYGPAAFNTNHVLVTQQFATSGAYRPAVLTTGDVELNNGGRAYVSGVKPNVEGATANAVSVRLGSRNDLLSSSTYTATTPPTSRTGFADFRADSNYFRAETQITGPFNKVTGIEFRAITAGEA